MTLKMTLSDQMHSHQDINTSEIAKLLPEDYQGGKKVTTRLLRVLNLTEYRSLSDAFDVSWGAPFPHGTVENKHHLK